MGSFGYPFFLCTGCTVCRMEAWRPVRRNRMYGMPHGGMDAGAAEQEVGYAARKQEARRLTNCQIAPIDRVGLTFSSDCVNLHPISSVTSGYSSLTV